MPRVPTYQPGQVGPVKTTNVRFRAPDAPNGMDMLAAGFNGLAGLADQQDKINFENDQTQTRLAVAGARQQYASAVDGFKQLKLGQARSGQEGFNAGLDKIKSDVLATAKTPRQRQMMEMELLDLDGSARRMGASWALDQQNEETQASFGIEQTSLIDAAVSSDNPSFRDQSGLQLRDSVRRQLAFQGFDEQVNPQAFAVAEKAALTKMHGGVIDRMFAVTDPPMAEIAAYEAAYGDEMTSDLRNNILKRLQGPMQDRLAMADADRYMGLAGPSGEAAAATADAPGASRLNAITIASESAGNPNAVSPKGARGLMQVMPGTARDPGFGIAPSNGTPEDDVRVGKQYRAKMEQRYGGDLAKMWAAYNWGPGNLDKAVAKHGDSWLDHAPSETKAYVRKNIAALGSSGTGYTPDAREWSADARQTALAAINRDVASGAISPERGQRARQQVENRIRTDESLMAERRRVAGERLQTIMLNAGDSYRESMVPPSVLRDLSPVDLASARAAERRIAEARAKAATEAAGQTATWQLEAQARFDPEGFKVLDLKKYVGVIPTGHLNTLAMKQAEMASKGPKPFSEVDYRGSIQSEINFQDKHNGLKLDDEQKVAMYDFMSGALSQVYQKKGSITKQDVSTIFQSGMRQVPNAKGWFGQSSARAYELLTDIPDDFQERFTASWSGRRPPTKGDMVSAYQQWLRAGRR